MASSATNGKNGKNGGSGKSPRRRATAESMAASQRDISVSEFFAKNRHLLGFDNPRKALLTTVKEAVDNALDACEEAGIFPEIWVHIELTGENQYKVGIQDNGPGILKKQIPLIFGKLLYGSKFHRLRMSRGQQGIGISAAGMYGVLTTGLPVRIVSKISVRKPVHYYEIQIDTKRNKPEILKDLDIPPNDEGRKMIEDKGIEWEDVEHGTRVTIDLEARYLRGRGSVDEYLEQTAVSNPHVALHFVDPDGHEKHYPSVVDVLPPEPVEIKPHPHGIELGMFAQIFADTPQKTVSQCLIKSFSRVTPGTVKRVCETARIDIEANPEKLNRPEVTRIYRAIQDAKIKAPSTDCITPIGEDQILQGLHKVVPGEFYTAATRPPAVYRGNPFQIEVGLAYGGATTSHRVSREELLDLLGESDARTIRQFLSTSFEGVGMDSADKILKQSKIRTRVSPANIKPKEIDSLHHVLREINLHEGQSMNVMRFANRVPLQFQAGACLITQSVMQTNWRSYGLQQTRGQLPRGPLSIMVHVASVWVPFTSESKEAIAAYPEIQKELRLALQTVGRKLGTFLRKRQHAKKEGERRNIFMRYLGEVATGLSSINGADREEVYERLVALAKHKTSDADMELDENGRPIIDIEELNLGDNVLIIDPNAPKNGDPVLEEGDELEDDSAVSPPPEGESEESPKEDQDGLGFGSPDEQTFID
jgi:DNA topoisomerase VI subunit B